MTSKSIAMALFTTASLITIEVATPAKAQDQRDQARANFQQADVNQDQHLDLAEFNIFIDLNADHGLGRASTIRRMGMQSRAFNKMDTNRDGLVSKQEVAARAQQ